MAATKVTGLGDNFYIAGYDVSGATNSLSKISGSVNPLDVTDITQSAHDRLGGVRDGAIDFVTYLDTAAGNSAHALFSQLQTTDVQAAYMRGTAVGNPAACMVAKQLNYDPTRAADGMLTFNVSLVANAYGLEWGVQQTAGWRTDTAATVGSFYDLASFYPSPVTFPISFGAQAYLQVNSFSGTDVTVNITHCATSGGVYTNLISFSQITGSTPLAQRASVSNTTTVNEFLKITTTTTGGFSSLKFSVVFVLNTVAGKVF